MHDEDRTREELLYDIAFLRARATDLENRNRQTEELLRVVTNQYKQITNAVSDYIFSVHIIDSSPVETMHGPGCLTITGYAPEEFAENSYLWINMVHEEDRPALLQHVAAILAGRDAGAFEHRIIRKDGVVRWVRNTPVCQHDAEGKLVAYDGLIQDITDRKQAEEALRRSEEKYRLVADYTYDWEYWIGPDGNYHYVSPSCERITGYHPEEFMQHAELMIDILHNDDREAYLHHIGAMMKPDAPPSVIDFRIITRTGLERWISHSCQAVFSSDNTWLGRRGSNRDITTKKQIQTQLVQAQRLQAVGILAEGIAHDFNNILTALLGNLSLALRSVEHAKCPREPLSHAEELCMQASALVHQLVIFSEHRIDLSDIGNPADLIASIVATTPLMPGITMNSSFAAHLPSLRADEQQIRELFRQLMLNAEEAMPGGGLVTVGTDAVMLGAANAFGLEPGTYLQITVQDEGRGIPAEHLPMIFDPYFTTKESANIRGIGLGLAICFSIARNHGGTITADSHPGAGSSFKVLLRAVQPEQKESPAPETTV